MNPLTVIIPSRNAANLVKCQHAVRRFSNGVRILCVWDRSRDNEGPPAIDGVEILETSEEFCYARNVNLGIRAAGESDVILLNDDALLQTEGGFYHLWNAVLMQPEYGIIAAATDVTGYSVQMPLPGARLREAMEIAFVCVLIPRKTLDWVGPLEERFAGVYGGEDNDYCYRVRRAGLMVGVSDGCFVNHSTLRSTFRPNGEGLPIAPARQRFREIHQFEMGSR